jgi:methyl-accepting chemotaxis protein
MKPSILRNTLLSFLAFGLLMGAVFPIYAGYFVNWKPGMRTFFVLGCLVAGLIMGFANYFVMNLMLLRNLRRISGVARAISEKDLTLDCTIQSHDTIGEIAHGMSVMAGNLREVIGKVAELGDQVNRDCQGMQVNLGGVSRRMEAQVGDAAEIRRAMEALSRTIADIAQHATEAASAGRQAETLTQDGTEVAGAVHAAMRHVRRVVEDAAHSVIDLGGKAEQIGDIVQVINGIAEQTNLLALNAAIEASHAGIHGRGFAVVAEEVRRLAEKSSHASQEIRDMIQSIQAGTQHLVQAMEGSTEQVQEGVAKAEAAGRSLDGILSSIRAVSGMVDQIAEGAEQQARTVATVEGRTREIHEVAAGTLHEARDTEGASTRLVEQAKDLSGLLGSFRLR